MEIRVLQSLIDRTSNEIAALEKANRQSLAFYHKIFNDTWEKDGNKFYYEGISKSIRKNVSGRKAKIAKLAKAQKALKKEIAKEIGKAREQRFYDRM